MLKAKGLLKKEDEGDESDPVANEYDEMILNLTEQANLVDVGSEEYQRIIDQIVKLNDARVKRDTERHEAEQKISPDTAFRCVTSLIEVFGLAAIELHQVWQTRNALHRTINP